jgi:hypothetical protein
MNKPLIIFLFFAFFAVAFFGFLTYTPPPQEYLDLEEQFNYYLSNDINTELNFIEYVNNLSLEHTNENVEVSIVTQLIETKFSGVIVQIQGFEVYAITQSDDFDASLHQRIFIEDFKGESYAGQLLTKSEDYPIALVKFTSENASTYDAADFSSTMPLVGEIVSSISFDDGILNHLELGTFSTTIDNDYYHLNMNYTETSAGSSVYDINLNLIGIRVMINDEMVMLTSDIVSDFLAIYG